MKFNPVNFIVSLIVGWFLISFLQAAGYAALNGDWGDLYARFQMIAFFKDGWGIFINVIAIVLLGMIGLLGWFKKKRQK